MRLELEMQEKKNKLKRKERLKQLPSRRKGTNAFRMKPIPF
jgi:hypothetical protein